jgi:hypothetical protein
MEHKTSEEFLRHWENSYVLFKKKSAEPINEFLGGGPLFVEIYEPDYFYWGLMAWSVKCIFAPPTWKIGAFPGDDSPQPYYLNILTDYAKFESCLAAEQMLVEKNGVR